MCCVCGESIHPSCADRSKESSRKTARGPTAPSSPRHTATLDPHPIGQSSTVNGPVCESESRTSCSLTVRRIPAFGGAVQASQTAHRRLVYPERRAIPAIVKISKGRRSFWPHPKNDEPGLLQLRPNLPAWLVSPVLRCTLIISRPERTIICRMKVKKGDTTTQVPLVQEGDSNPTV